jgi:hypothetical protein
MGLMFSLFASGSGYDIGNRRQWGSFQRVATGMSFRGKPESIFLDQYLINLLLDAFPNTV